MAWPLSTLVLFSWAILCAWQDMRYGRISNGLTYPAIIAATCHLVIFSESTTGATSLQALLATGCALLLALPGWLAGKLGGGDVKMLLVIALASSPFHLLASVSFASLALLLWLLTPSALRARLPQIERRSLLSTTSTVIYGPFLLVGMIPAFVLFS